MIKYAETPPSNEVFTVLGRADYLYERECKDGTIWACSLFECVCNFCGKRRDLTKFQIKTYKSRGCRQHTKSRKEIRDGKTLTEIAKEFGVERSTVFYRLKKGLTLNEALAVRTEKGIPLKNRRTL